MLKHHRYVGVGLLRILSFVPFPLPDELASFLLSVKALEYEERPDYQRLRELLSEAGPRASGGQGRLDLSVPRGAMSGGSSTRGSDWPDRGKVRVAERLPCSENCLLGPLMYTY